jgi:hypothetical protein
VSKLKRKLRDSAADVEPLELPDREHEPTDVDDVPPLSRVPAGVRELDPADQAAAAELRTRQRRGLLRQHALSREHKPSRAVPDLGRPVRARPHPQQNSGETALGTGRIPQTRALVAASPRLSRERDRGLVAGAHGRARREGRLNRKRPPRRAECARGPRCRNEADNNGAGRFAPQQQGSATTGHCGKGFDSPRPANTTSNHGG